jgi:hypothetical protein
VHLDDERAAGRVVGVAVHLHHAVRRLLDVELERVEDQVGAEPYVPAAPDVEIRSERGREGGSGGRVGPVGGHDQIVAGRQLAGIRCLLAEAEGHPELAAALLQDLQQPTPAQRGEAVAAAGDRLALDVHVDVIPAGELALHGAVHHRVGVLDAAQGLVREHHAEAERVVGRVPLPHGDLALRGQLLGQGREVQPARPPAHDRDAQPVSLPVSHPEDMPPQ